MSSLSVSKRAKLSGKIKSVERVIISKIISFLIKNCSASKIIGIFKSAHLLITSNVPGGQIPASTNKRSAPAKAFSIFSSLGSPK